MVLIPISKIAGRRIRAFIGEIHRRSLWQVLTVYFVASWAVLGGVGTLGDALGLPDWFPRFAFAALLVGLPMVLATAVVGQPRKTEGAATEEGRSTHKPGPRLITWQNALLAGVSVLALSAFLGTAWILFGLGLRRARVGGSVAVSAVRSLVGTSQHVTFGNPVAVSPDGGTVVYVGGDGVERQLMRRRLDDLTATPIEGTEGATNPFFSPDGEWVGFSRNWGIGKVRLDGGGAFSVLAEGAGEGAGATWHDGWIYFWDMETKRIARVPEDGGLPELVEVPDPEGERTLVFWSHLPGGDGLLATDWRFPPQLVVLDSRGEPSTIDTTAAVFGPRIVGEDLLVFGRPDGTLHAARFDARQMALKSSPVTIATGVEVANWTPQFAVSPSGVIAYVRDTPDELVVDPIVEPVRLLTDERLNFHQTVELSPDGHRIALAARDGIGEQLRVYERDGRGQFLTRGQQVHHPIWGPDGQSLTYGWWDRGVIMLPSSGGEGELLVAGLGQWRPASWNPDATRLIYMNLEDYEPRILERETGETAAFSPGTSGVSAAHFSPDGAYVAFQSLHIEDLQIWVQRVDDDGPTGTPVRMSFDGGVAPHWSEDGRALHYIRWQSDRPQVAHLVRVDVNITPELGPGSEVVVADWSLQGIDSAYRFDIDPNGHFVRIRTAATRDVVLLQNWRADLDELEGGG